MNEQRPLFLAVLMGAAATAIGMGLFLKLANDDRRRLAQEIDRARQTAEVAILEKERMAAEASEKVEEANAEISNAQRVLADLEKERKLLAVAVRLDPPPTRDVRGWTPVTTASLAVSASLPPGTSVAAHPTDDVLSAVHTSRPNDPPWLRITPFDARIAAELEASLTEVGERAYLVNGRLVSGAVGLKNGVRTWSFRVWRSASSTHAIVFTDPGTFGSGNGAERFLSTMTFGN